MNIPQNAEIEVGEKPLATETISGTKGAWRTCSYKGKSGYVFDGFLQDAPEEDKAVPVSKTTVATPPPAPKTIAVIVETASGRCVTRRTE